MISVLIDTTGACLEIAMLNDGKPDYIMKEGLKHSLTLLPAFKEILDRNGLTPADIGALGIVNGPGSFTGIRIGLSTVKAMSYALNIPVFAVNALRVAAYNTDVDKGAVIAVSDAANGYAYLAAYEGEEELLPPKCLTLAELEKFLATVEAGEAVEGYPFKNAPREKGLIKALREYTEKACFVAEKELQPLYVRKPQAEEIKN